MASNYYQPVIWHQMGSKGHSPHSSRSDTMPARRREPVSMPRVIPSSYVRHDYGIDDSISRMGYLSNAVLEDTYDAAAKSRGKDHDLLRNANSAIRPSPGLGISSPGTGRRSHRFRSLPPSRDRSTSPALSSLMSTTSSVSPLSKSKALVPYGSANAEKLRLAMAPHPTSLLSNRISAFLRGSSVPPKGSSGISYKSYLDSANPPTPSLRDNASSVVSYKSFLSDPSVTSPFTTRSSSRLYKGYEPPSYTPAALQPYRSMSVPRYNISYNVDENEDEDDDEDYVPGDYRRKMIRDGNGDYGRRPRVLYYKTSSPEGSDVEDENYDTGTSGTYSQPRPLGASPLRLSSYDAPHDGSYEADMAEMYDYVPFGPSRQGILELTQHEDFPNDDNSDVQPSSISSTSYTHPTTSSYPLIRSIPPSVSLIPHTSQPSPGELTTPSSSFAQTPVFERILANTAARARDALRDSSLPYKDASLVLSLEGSALSEDGKNRYGFRYYPPPIPLKGAGVGLDERLLGIVPQAVSPADSFLGGYLSRLRGLRSDMENRADGAEERARGRSVVPRPLPPLPSYSHQTIHMPVHIAGRAKSVPVSSYRSQLDGGVAHRVDVYPLLETQARLPKGAGRLPLFKAASGGDSSTKLSILDKINIKISTESHATPRASVVSRKARATSVPPISGQSTRPGYPKVAGARPSIMLVSAPVTNTSTLIASRPVVLSEKEAPWHLKARAGSIPPSGVRVIRAGSVPPRPRSVAVDNNPSYQSVGTEGLKAHNPMLIRQLRARSVGPMAATTPAAGNRTPYRYATLGRSSPRGVNSALPRAMAHDIDNRLQRLVRSASEPRDLDRASALYPVIPDVKQRALSRYLYAHRGRFGAESRPRPSSLADFPLVYVPRSGPGPSNRAKAAIIGSKMEAEDGAKKKKKGPRSAYAAAKYRETRKEPSEEGIFYNTVSSGSLQASKPPLPKPTDRKSIRDLDGFTKPKNVMSWQYRVESRLTPDDLIEQPASFSRMRNRVREAQEKMDRHRQLLDRYLDKDTISSTSRRNDDVSGGSRSVKIPAYYAAGGDPNQRPVSELRRRIRRTIAKAKNNADYYRE